MRKLLEQLADGIHKVTWPARPSFGDIITAAHKILNEEGESWNNQRYAFVVQDLSIKRIRSYPCKTKAHKKRREIYGCVLISGKNPKVIQTDKSVE